MKTETGMIEEKIGRGKKEERNDVEWTKKTSGWSCRTSDTCTGEATKNRDAMKVMAANAKGQGT